MNSAANHPSVQSAKDTVVNGEVSTAIPVQTSRAIADAGLQMSEKTRIEQNTKPLRTRRPERAGRGHKDAQRVC